MELRLQRSTVRSFRASDVSAIARHANNRKIWLNLRDRFPHPYKKADAKAFLRMVRTLDPETLFAIDADGEVIGSIGYQPGLDVERVSAEIGYWIGEAYWGRGIVTEALQAVTRYAIEQHQLTRIFARPFATNAASCRVLERAGYVLEARLRRSAVKDGVIQDQLQYCFIPPD